MSHRATSLVFFGNEKLATGLASVEPVIQAELVKNGYKIEAHVLGKELPTHTSRVAVLASYGKILPQKVLDEFELGIINVHPSLLPQYRGPTPIEQAILDGAAKTGVSIMKLTAEMDAGPIYRQKSIALSGDESKAEIATKLQFIGAKLLVSVLNQVISGKATPRPQPHPDRASYTHLIRKTDATINWHKSAVDIQRHVRAYLGWPGSKVRFGEKEITLTDVEPSNEVVQTGIIALQDKRLLIGCLDGSVVVNRLKPAGKVEMSTQSYLAGNQSSLPDSVN